MRVLFIAFVLGLGSINPAVAQCSLSVGANYGPGALVLDSLYDNTFTFTTFRFYISNLQIQDSNQRLIYTHTKKHLLIDLRKPKTQHIILPDTTLRPSGGYTLKLGIGIDSTTNSLGAMAGDLDPVSGMYWTWQSGYINVKLEGTRKVGEAIEKFEFHLGGYAAPYNSYRMVQLPYGTAITVQLDRLMKQLNGSQNHIMSPSKATLIFMDDLAANTSTSF